MLMQYLNDVIVTALNVDISSSEIDWVIKSTERNTNENVIILLSINRLNCATLKLAFCEYGYLMLDNEIEIISKVKDDKLLIKHIPKILYHGKFNGINILMQEYIHGVRLLHLIANKVYTSEYELIKEYCLFVMDLLAAIHNANCDDLETIDSIIKTDLLMGKNKLIDMHVENRRKVLDSAIDNISEIKFRTGIFHGDFCIDNIIKNKSDANLTFIDWEFGKKIFLVEFDALFFCLSFLEAVYFRILKKSNKSIKDFINFLSGNNEFTKIAQKAISYYLKKRNLCLSFEQLQSLFFVLLVFLSVRENELYGGQTSECNKFYDSILAHITKKDSDIEWLRLA